MSRMMGSRNFVMAVLAVAGLALPSSVSASVLFGTLDVNGGVRVTETMIDFTPVGAGGLENIALTSTFSVNGNLADPCSNCVTAVDLNNVLFPVSGFTSNLDNYEELAEFPTLNFQLQDILSCTELTALPGSGICPLGGGSAFAFSQSPGGTTVTFSGGGEVWDTVGPLEVYDFTALYTAQFPGLTIAQVLFAFDPACVPGVPIPGGVQTCGFIDTSFSASKITIFQDTGVVPEPATLLLLGTGLVGAAARARRRRSASV